MPRPTPAIPAVSMPVRVKPDVRRGLNELAQSQGRSLNDLCAVALGRLLDPKPAEAPLPRPVVEFGVGSGVEILTIMQNGPDRWNGAVVQQLGRHGESYPVEILGGPRRGLQVWISERDRGRAWR